MIRKFLVTLLSCILFFSTTVFAGNYTILERGIDVSSYQGLIDWEAVSKDDVHFAFIRCKSAVTGVDTMFDVNMVEALKHDIPVGVYYYSGATTDKELYEEVSYLLESVKDYKITLPLVLDIEGAPMANLGKERLERNVKLFNDLVTKAGYKPMIYTGENFLDNYLYDTNINKWIARYSGDLVNNRKDICYWQYSSKGRVKGINGNVDMNYSLVPSSEIIKLESM